MNKPVKEPYFAARIFNLTLGVAIMLLIVMRFVARENAAIYEMLIFLLAAIENFIGATISFMQQKRFRGNVYAIICTLFFIVALLLAVRYFVFV